MKFFKTVLLPITVPEGDYCSGQGRCCENLDNRKGISCDMELDFREEGIYCKLLYYDKEGNIPKPTYCKNLKEVEGG